MNFYLVAQSFQELLQNWWGIAKESVERDIITIIMY